MVEIESCQVNFIFFTRDKILSYVYIESVYRYKNVNNSKRTYGNQMNFFIQ